MVRINSNYERLSAGYLFPEIARRTRQFLSENPGVELLRLGIGDTTEPLVPEVVKGLHDAVSRLSQRETYSGYGDSEGQIALREAIVKRYAGFGAKVNSDEVFVSDGAKPDTGNIQSIFDPDAVVAVQDPAYPVYVDTNVIAGRGGVYDADKGQYGRIVYMPCTMDNGFFPELPAGKTDLIYLCSPNNPTGAVATAAQLKMFVTYAIRNSAVILFDAAYCDYIRDASLPRTIYEIEGADACAIECYSLSKGAGFTGVRLGWTVVPKKLTVEDGGPGKLHQLWTRRQNTFFNGASNVVQGGALAALSEAGVRQCADMVGYYMENAVIIREGLTAMGLTCFGGENAPYIWLRTPDGMGSWAFFDKMLREAHVVGTPGAGFGPSGEGFFRLSAFGHREQVIRAVEQIRTSLQI